MSDWAARAACRSYPKDLFFPAEGDGVPSVVREVCGGCVVRSECAEEGERTQSVGVWGGVLRGAGQRAPLTFKVCVCGCGLSFETTVGGRQRFLNARHAEVTRRRRRRAV